MLLEFDINLAKNYKSPSQIIRICSEDWVSHFIFCPNCQRVMQRHKNNNPAADFYCEICKEDFKLKSKRKVIGNKINGGAYKIMIEKITVRQNPNLFLLTYDQNYKVTNFLVIPKHFFTASMIEKRNALSSNAVRAGWIGCNILISLLPKSGKIFYVKDGIVTDKDEVSKKWHKTLFLKNENEQKGWIFEIMRCMEKLDKKSFARQELLSFMPYLQKKYPNNKNIEYKISRQLQILRNNNYLKFSARGNYQLL
ncbi:MAG: restriction endonuclease [Campylobacteraceae bacterium]|jgi:type II restriction enzyme|nr:restriction endonuclease [Campylobacteraceae bacterium]